jgi:predicted PurR-regulated permease PerM
MDDPQSNQKVQVEITWTSIFRVLAGVLVACVAVALWPVFKVLVLATLLAVALSPVVSWTTRKGWPRWLGLLLATLAMVVMVVALLAIIGPLVYRQASVLGQNLPKLRDQIVAQLPPSGMLHQVLERGMNTDTVENSRRALEQALVLAKTTARGLFEFVMVLALAVYLIADGFQILRWLIVFFPADQRQKISLGLKRISELIFSYVAGQCLVSVLAAVYATVVLELLGVPMALLLGIIAGVCDILPLIGFVVAVVLMVMMAVTVSPTTAVSVFLLYGAYHLLENFFIIPKVYGKKLRLSPVAVPLAVAAGSLLAGVSGAIAALPIVAAYPVIEKLWLAPRLEEERLKRDEEAFGLK